MFLILREIYLVILDLILKTKSQVLKTFDSFMLFQDAADTPVQTFYCFKK
jgi:hypothetical protein